MGDLAPAGSEWFQELRIFNADGTSQLIAQSRGQDRSSPVYRFGSVQPALNNHGQVAFLATVRNASNQNLTTMFLWTGTELKVLAQNGQNGIREVEFFPPDINDSGLVVFRAIDSSSMRAVWVSDGVDIKRVVSEHDIVPSDLGPARIDQETSSNPVFAGGPLINARGDITFVAGLAPPETNQEEWGTAIFVAQASYPTPDAGTDAGTETPDSGTDAGSDAGTDAGSGEDAGTDAGSGEDAGADAGTEEDAGTDAGSGGDAGSDAGPGEDAGSGDAGSDAGSSDAGSSDAGSGEDAGSGNDAGTDAGSGEDAGSGDAGSDAGSGEDAGSSDDAGTDAGTDGDAGTSTDAGTADAGSNTPPDAGTDGGPPGPRPGGDSGCGCQSTPATALWPWMMLGLARFLTVRRRGVSRGQ